MHLTHCTSGGTCIDIMAELVIRPKRCEVYGADLLYLFYGRPAFKPLPGVAPNSLTETAPVCLVLDPALIADAVRILPFDSGGFARYGAQIGPGLGLRDFELEPKAETPLKLVGAFYETTHRYYHQAHRQDLVIPLSEREAAAYGRLIADGSIADDDDRRGTIEIQLAGPVFLKGALKALIAPAVLLDDPAVSAALASCPDAVPLDYRTYGRMPPSGLSYALYDRLASFFEKRLWTA